MKDLVVYTTSGVRSENYEARDKILHGAVEELDLLLNGEIDYKQIIVVGHSLGSVIAYDALDLKQHSMTVLNPDRQDQASKIKGLVGLVTLGSPLDKVSFFFDVHIPLENTIQRGISSHLHNLKRRRFDFDKSHELIKDPFQNWGRDLTWLNFYHKDDLASGKLDLYEVEDQMECKGTVPHVSPHSSYWQRRSEFHYKIIEHFFQRWGL